MAALRFLSTLPEVKADDLTEDSCCDICLRPYGTVETKDEIAEGAIKLPCGHVMGYQCIKKWLSPTNSGKNTCPYCRHQFFPLPTRERTVMSRAEAIRLMRLNAGDHPMTADYIDNLVQRMEGDEGSPQREIWEAHLRFLADHASEQGLSPTDTRWGLHERLTRRLAVLDANGSRQARASRRPPPGVEVTMEDVQTRRRFEEQMASSASQFRQIPQHILDRELNAFERALQLTPTHGRNPYEQRLPAPERDPIDQGPPVINRYPRNHRSSNVLAQDRNQFGYGPPYPTGDAGNPPIAPTARMTNGEDTPTFPPPSYGSFPVPHMPDIVRVPPGPTTHFAPPTPIQGQAHWTSSMREVEYGEAQMPYWGHHHHFHHHHFHHPAPRASHPSAPRYQPPAPLDVPSYQNIGEWGPTNRGRGGRGFISQTRGGRGFPFQNWRDNSGRWRPGGVFGGRGSPHVVPSERTTPSSSRSTDTPAPGMVTPHRTTPSSSRTSDTIAPPHIMPPERATPNSSRTTDTPAPGMVTSHRTTPSNSRTTDIPAPYTVPQERVTPSSSRTTDTPAPDTVALQREMWGNSRSLDTLASNTPDLHGASSTNPPSLAQRHFANFPDVLAGLRREVRAPRPASSGLDPNVNGEENGEEG